MNAARTLFIDGIAFWAPALPGWPLARAVLRGEAAPADPPARRPAPALLAANERRRAPDAVLLALEVASAALAASGHDGRQMASVFTSTHGDLPITDAMCRTLADNPLLLSPTRFHHAVHNAASGYWAIGSSSHAASTALAGGAHSFGAGLLEAACQSAAEDTPVLLAGHDTEASGPLASVNRSRGLLAVALVLAPRRSAASSWRLSWTLEPGAQGMALGSAAARMLAGNALADALPLFEALATGVAATLTMPVSPTQQLRLQLEALPDAGPSAGSAPPATPPGA